MKKSRILKLASVVLAVALATILPAQAASALTSADVTVTVTPGRVSISLDNTTWTPGTLDEAQTYYSTDSVSVTTQTDTTVGGLADGECYWTATNNGNGNIKVVFTSGNWTGGATPWTNGDGTPDDDAYALWSAASGATEGAWVIVKSAASDATIATLAGDATKKFAFKLTMPTLPTVLDAKTGTITLTASRPG